MSKRKAPKGCFWRGGVLWGRVQVKGGDVRWSLRTDDPVIARSRRQTERDRQVAIEHYGDARRTVAEALEAWQPQILRQVARKTALRYAVSLGQLQPFLDGVYLDEVDRKLITDIISRRRAQNVTDATIKRDLGALSSVMNHVVAIGWRDDNPVLAALKQVKERRDPIELPAHADVRTVIARAPGMLAQLTEAAWLTGCRQEELTKGRHAHLDHARRQLTVVGKGNKLRTIDLDDAAYGLFAKLPRHLTSPWLFWHHDGEPFRTVSGQFRVLVAGIAARAKAQKQAHPFRRFTFHHLRHLHAVDWLKSGRSIYDLQQRLGHSSIKTTEMYLCYLTAEEQRAVMFGSNAAGTKTGT